MRIAKVSIFIGLLTVFLSCDRSAWFEQFITLPDARWHADSAAVFTFQTPDTLNGYDLEIILRSNENFPYSNLYLFLERQGENSNVIDTLEHLMTLPDGRWTGKGYGAMKENLIRYKLNYRFEENEKINLFVRHGMRDVYLKGVEDVGFRISLSQEKSSR